MNKEKSGTCDEHLPKFQIQYPAYMHCTTQSFTTNNTNGESKEGIQHVTEKMGHEQVQPPECVARATFVIAERKQPSNEIGRNPGSVFLFLHFLYELKDLSLQSPPPSHYA